MQTWKLAHIVKGTLTWIPMLNSFRLRNAATGGSSSARYCYAVWLRHLVMLNSNGFRIKGARVGELGPGDSVGIGLAALISGATSYTGLDIVPFSRKADLVNIFRELFTLYERREPIPGEKEFPKVRPTLDTYAFPDHLIDWGSFSANYKSILRELETNPVQGEIVSYIAPWSSPTNVKMGSLDLVFSQAVLEHVDKLDETYQAMSSWLKPGGSASHVIDFSSHWLSPYWNGHWAYSDWEWRLVRGRREFLLNRQPLSAHLACIKNAGFDVTWIHKDNGENGLQADSLSKRFRWFDQEDGRIRGVVLVLRKK